MDLAHIHLLLNHFPVIGTIIGGGLFLISLITNSDDLKRASLVVLLGIALLSIPTYMSGNGAQQALASQKDFSKSLIETHEGVALEAMVFMEILGAFAWLGLWQFRRLARVPRWNLAIILVLTLVTLTLMARASNIVLMCAEEDPLECHRFLMVCPALLDRGVTPVHIRRGGALESQREAEDLLLKLHDLTAFDSGSLFVSERDAAIRDALRLQAKVFAFRASPEAIEYF